MEGRSMHNLLIIDSDTDLRKSVTEFFRNNGYEMDEASDFETAVKLIGERLFEVIISDYRINDGVVTDLLEVDEVRSVSSMIIIATERDQIDEAIQAIRMGAFDYIQKPFSIPEIEIKVRKAIEHRRLMQETSSLHTERDILYSPENFMGDSAQIKEVFELVKRISKTDASVLLTGETGTGKELIAGAIHYNSQRADGPFIKVNCATLPDDTIESELFGHEVGAFIGADTQKIGQFEEANSGTIFLDEISEMPLGAQEKLLRIIQEKEFGRLGGERPIPIDVRVISATNKDLIREIELKRFRSDLFYRLNMITINLPPLRQRKGDILLLTYFFQKRYSEELNKNIREIHPLALKQLTEYTWPGNIRELENTIERAVLMAKVDVITPEDLRIPMNMNFEEWDYNSIKIPPSGIKLEELERKLLLQALKMTDWVKKDAAKLLGISERVLNHKIKRFKISHPRWIRK